MMAKGYLEVPNGQREAMHSKEDWGYHNILGSYQIIQSSSTASQ